MKKVILLCLIVSQFSHLNALNAQINICDSVSYTIPVAQTFTVTLNTTPGLTNMIDSIDILWSVCNTSICYTETGTIASFPNILQTDTVKVCYDVYIYIDTMTYFCYVCDSLLYDGNSWELLNPSLSGCTDPAACNYNSMANVDDGSCILPDGCTDVLALNYDPNALCDDGSCQYVTEIADLSPFLISEFYPNPAKEIVYFDYYLNQPAKLIMMDILGNEVKTIKLLAKGKQKVNISDLSKGIYFGNVIANNEIVTIKKIIVR